MPNVGLLLTAYCLLLTAYCLLLTASGSLLVAPIVKGLPACACAKPHLVCSNKQRARDQRPATRDDRLENNHRVAIRVEPILALQRLGVRVHR
jgi:hypothetical protein